MSRQATSTAPRPARGRPLVEVPPAGTSAVRAFVSIGPFSYAALDRAAADAAAPPVEDTAARLAAHVGRPHQLADSGRHALDLALAELGLAPDDVVTIVTTSGGRYVSGCVTRTVERHCRWSLRREPRTRAFLAIHEWGRACEAVRDLLPLGLPVVEDCAYAFASRYADGTPVGALGDHAVYSLSKMFAVNYGGVVAGPLRRAAEMPAARRRYLLAMIGPELARLPEVCAERVAVWRALAARFADAGARPFYDLEPGTVPAVFLFAADPARVPLAALREHFERQGVEAGIFYGEDAAYVPCHQHVGPGTRELLARLYEDALGAVGVGGGAPALAAAGGG